MKMKQLSKMLCVWLLANLMIGVSFQFSLYFWILFPLSLSILIYISIKSNCLKVADHSLKTIHIFYGLLSGSLLYCVFLVAYLLLKLLNLPLLEQVQELYSIVGPTQWWHYLLILIIIIPGEEIFWRGYIQSQMVHVFHGAKGIVLAACFYAIAHIWTGNLMLVAAAATAGMVWGALYEWKKSLPLVIISHLAFDLWLLMLFPLNF
ncbi:CPBP family intramembrane glutamic endopeptidase [Sutcliffiella halmapala]|uniref:CPBP family intramembrane glutamic endopeptidase n=1 Tax=Sutcliffiella halmapala TaxID=79882 RepID=UPI0009956B70|nr:type II CAAX endopeptidase family protein [Sutcliffiella halmapala]